MNHLNQFKQNRKQNRSFKNVPLKIDSFVANETTNLEEQSNKAAELCLQRFSVFNLQNVETGRFDVTFQFGTKELHAHSFILWTASEVFETMIFGAWAKKEPIPITSHSFEDFKEFLTFFYLGKCNINMENVMALVDLSESYNIQLLKDSCDEYLTNVAPTVENFFQLVEPLKIYSLKNALENLYEFIAINATNVLKSEAFLEVEKEMVLEIVKMERLIIKEEELFDTVFKWAKHQSQKEGKEDSTGIKEELTDILPYIRFPIMNIEFLHNTIVNVRYLFSSYDELSLILLDADAFHKKMLIPPPSSSRFSNKIRRSYNIQITDKNGNAAHTFVPNSILERLGEQFYSNNNSNNYDPTLKEYFWNIKIPKPMPKKYLFDLNSCKFYLIRNHQGLLAIKDFSTDIVNPGHNQMRSGSRLINLRNRKILNSFPVNQNIAKNVQNDPGSSEIIARVYPENHNFSICEGCVLKVLFVMSQD